MNVKKGDLAIVIKDIFDPENIGIICRVGQYVGHDLDDNGVLLFDLWEVDSVGRPFKFSDGITDYEPGCYFEDACLRPISGLPECDDVPAAEPIREAV